MNETIDQVKNRLRQSYIGKNGIHGIGIYRAQQAIRVYVSERTVAGQPRLLEQLRESAKPFSVIVVEEEQPRLT